MKKHYKMILIFVITLLSLMAIFLSLDKANMENVTTNSHTQRVILNFSKSLPRLDISHFFMFVFIFYFYNQVYFKNEKYKKSIGILSILLSLCLIFGYSFYKTNSWDLVFGGEIQILKSLIKTVGYYFIIYALINKLYEGIQYLSKAEAVKENKYLSFIFDKHPNLCIVGIILLIWLPIIIVFFPGIPTYDGITQINQLLGKYQAVHIDIINPNVTINNHHPLLSTLIIGGFIQIGKLINNIDLGIYLYVLCQTAFMIYTILYSFKIMKKMNISNGIKLVCLIIYIICPIFLIFSLNILKDVIFSICMFYYILLLIEILIDNDVLKKKTYLLKLIIILFLVMMFRNNGVYSILLSFPFLIFMIKQYRKRILLCLAIPLIIYFTLNKVIYPILEIAPGSIKEALSIPFQQTARTLYEGKEYEEEDLEIINQILDVEVISEKYNPILSDPVKNTFNKKYTSEQLMSYFKVWFKYLFKYPSTYIEATLNNSYAYLYPNKANLVGYCEPPDYFVEENPLEMKHLQTFQGVRNVLNQLFKLEMKAPIIGTLLNAGFHNWILLILALYTIQSKQKRFIIVHIALISILLVCIASPYYAIRYMLSIVYSLPILFALSIYISRKDIEEIKEIKGESDRNGE